MRATGSPLHGARQNDELQPDSEHTERHIGIVSDTEWGPAEKRTWSGGGALTGQRASLYRMHAGEWPSLGAVPSDGDRTVLGRFARGPFLSDGLAVPEITA